MKTSLLVDILASILGGIITGYYFKSPDYGFFASLFIFFSLEIPRARYELQKIESSASSMLEILQSLKQGDELAELKLIYGLREVSATLKGNAIRVPGDPSLVFDLWRNCVARTRNKWQALSYVKGPWTTGWGRQSLLAQEERVRSGCTLERVFVVDSLAEASSLSSVMSEQNERQIKVGWILREELMKNDLAKQAYSKVGSFDFAVIDGRWLYITELDDERHLAGAKASGDKGLVTMASLLYTEALSNARFSPPA